MNCRITAVVAQALNAVASLTQTISRREGAVMTGGAVRIGVAEKTAGPY
jgi:hypothetical protein